MKSTHLIDQLIRQPFSLASKKTQMISDSLLLHLMTLLLILLIKFFCIGKSKITGIETIVTALTDSY